MKYFIYARKSSESEDRQVQSIDDQKSVLEKLAKAQHWEITRVFEEAASAKAPGRKVFNEMLTRIHAGDARGILCWKLDRLSRNPVDGGNINWLLQQNIIRHIVTPERDYRPGDNVLLMAVEQGMANQFILDLSRNVKRGLRSKWEKGWPTTLPPLGYMNDIENQTVVPDPDRFTLVRKIWDAALTGAYKPARIAEMAARQWGLTTRRKKALGNPVSTHAVYGILKNPFYYGEFIVRGERFKGAYKPMITQDEFHRVQVLIGSKKAPPRPSRRKFAFTGLITCGECGCRITAEMKIKKNKTNGKSRTYVYYHCTRKRNNRLAKPCGQGSIEKKELERQIIRFLDRIQIPDIFMPWAQKILAGQTENDFKSREAVKRSLQRRLSDAESRLTSLFKLKLSPENRDDELLSDLEFKKQKNEITAQKTAAQNELDKLEDYQERFIDLTQKTLNFCRIAKDKFETGTDEEKRIILSCVSSNLLIKDKNLCITGKKVFQAVENRHRPDRGKPRGLEPRESTNNIVVSDDLESENLVWQGLLHEVRTALEESSDVSIPDFSESTSSS